MVSIGEVYRAAVPSFFLLESETIIKSNLQNASEAMTLELNDEEYLLLDALQKRRGGLAAESFLGQKDRNIPVRSALKAERDRRNSVLPSSCLSIR